MMRHSWLAALVLALSGGCGSRQSAPEQELLEVLDVRIPPQAEAMREAHNQRRAAIEQAPGNLGGWANLAFFYHANSFLAEAGTLYTALHHYAPSDGRWPYLHAMILQDLGELDQAQQLLAQAGAAVPTYHLVTLREANLLWKRGEVSLAEEKFRECIRRGWFPAHAHQGIALMAVKRQAWDVVVQHAEASISHESGMASAYKLMATALAKLGRESESATAAALASHYGRQPDPVDPWWEEMNKHCFDGYRLTVIADVLVASNRQAAAQLMLKRACEVAPRDARARFDLAMLFKDSADHTEIRRQLLEEVVRLNPGFNDAFLELALLHLTENDESAARAVVARGLAADPRSPGLHRMRGLVSERAEEWAVARSAFERALELNPRDPESHVALGNFLWARGDREAAIARYERAAELSILLVKPRAMLATHHIERGDYDTAIGLIDAAIRLETEVEGLDELLSLALLRKGNTALRQRQWADGEAALRRSLQVNPSFVEAFNNLNELFRATGRFAEGNDLAAEFVEGNPASGWGYVWLARMQHAAGEYELARSTLLAGYQVVESAGDSEQVALLQTEMSRR